MDWILIILWGAALGGVGDVKIERLGEAQCRAALGVFEATAGQVGAVCVGPQGQFLVAWEPA